MNCVTLSPSERLNFILYYRHQKIEIMSSGKLLLGVLGGVAAGALLGILFAPDKGATTRKKITDKGEDYVDAVKEKFDEFLDSISEKLEKVKEEYTGFVEEGKLKAEEIKKDVNAF
jgi:gas vesicle protein